MQLEQTFTVAASPEAVWQAFHDPALLVSCLPGASLRAPAQDGVLPLAFKVKLGPIAAAFAGEGTLALDEAARAGVFSGQAADGRNNSRVKGQARFRTEPDGQGTRVAVDVSFAITGTLAQFSREGIVRALADQLTRQFAENLQAQLSANRASAPGSKEPAVQSTETIGGGDGQAVGQAAGHPAPGHRATQGQALNLWTLLGALLKGYWRRLTGGRAS